MKWPKGGVQAGAKSSRVTCLTDVLATVADAIQLPLPAGAGEDSFSFLPDARGNPPAGRRPAVVNHSAAGFFAVRRGPWKLVLANGSGGRQQPRGKAFAKPYHLYNLDEDPSETNNLIEEKPDTAAALESEFKTIRGGDL